jgi:hypothetical protein
MYMRFKLIVAYEIDCEILILFHKCVKEVPFSAIRTFSTSSDSIAGAKCFNIASPSLHVQPRSQTRQHMLSPSQVGSLSEVLVRSCSRGPRHRSGSISRIRPVKGLHWQVLSSTLKSAVNSSITVIASQRSALSWTL